MSIVIPAVQWNRAKLTYDAILLAAVALYVCLFMVVGRWLLSPAGDLATWEELRVRAFGTCSFLMLTIILSIGPLSRLNRRFLPLLYNRRHFGVLTFLVASLHASFVANWYLSRGKGSEFLAFISNAHNYGTIGHFPYEALGVISLAIMFLMAATSHDFWLSLLRPPVWKAMHMAIYIAYGLLVMHVALGAMQFYRSAVIPTLLVGAVIGVAMLHLIAGFRENFRDHDTTALDGSWIRVGPVSSIPDGAAKIVMAPGGERIAVFRDGGRVGALSNLCAHQNGPLGEGSVADGCVTCPWHGHQFRLVDGSAPAPFTDKVATFRVRIAGGIVEVESSPQPRGTLVQLAELRLIAS